MEMKIAKSLKWLLGVAAIVVVILLGCLFFLKNHAKKTWIAGFYPFDFDINVCVYDKDTSFDINALVVGEAFLKLLEDGKVRCTMIGTDISAEGECSLKWYIEDGKSYQVGLELCPKLMQGEYEFYEIQFWNDYECLATAKGTADVMVIIDEEKDKDYVFSIASWWLNSSECEFVYQIINNSDEELNIKLFTGRPENAIGKTVMTIVNHVDLREGTIDFTKEEVCEFPITIDAQKKAYIRYVLPLTEDGMFYNQTIYPALLCETDEGKEKMKLALGYKFTSPIITVTQKQIAEYIAERGTK